MKLCVYMNNTWGTYELISESIPRGLEELVMEGGWEGNHLGG